MLGGIGVLLAKQFRWRLYFVAADSNSNDVAISIFCREFEDLLGSFRPELTHSVEYPKQRKAEVLFSSLASAFKALENCFKIQLAPKTHANGNIHLGVEHIFRFKLLHEAVCDQFVVVWCLQVFSQRLECHQEAGKIFVLIECFDFCERALFPMSLAEFDQRPRRDRPFEMQM